MFNPVQGGLRKWRAVEGLRNHAWTSYQGPSTALGTPTAAGISTFPQPQRRRRHILLVSSIFLSEYALDHRWLCTLFGQCLLYKVLRWAMHTHNSPWRRESRYTVCMQTVYLDALWGPPSAAHRLPSPVNSGATAFLPRFGGTATLPHAPRRSPGGAAALLHRAQPPPPRIH